MNQVSPFLRLFLGGDVMTGRGVDQILQTPSDPKLFETWISDARDYVRLAETVSGPIPRGVAENYVWGDLLSDLKTLAPDIRIVNLETAITRSDKAEPKGINYRMHPDNAGVLFAASLDVCILANNHVMDWGTAGLIETLDTLRARGISAVGAGMTEREAWGPCILPAGGERRLLVVACAAADSGVPAHWAAGPSSPGIALLPDPAIGCVSGIQARIAEIRRPGDMLLISVHWGGNWGYEVPAWQRDLAHAFVDMCQADIVFGHSSHHPKASELYRGRLVLYGSGDLINDYEGIGGHEDFPAGIVLGYFVDVAPVGEYPVTCRMRPYEIHRFRLERAGAVPAMRLADVLAREYARKKTPLVRDANGDLLVTAPPL